MSTKMVVIQLPQRYDTPPLSNHLKAIVAKSKEIRLESLRSDPSAFSSNLARKLAFDDSVWESRLTNPVARVLIALDINDTEISGDEVNLLLKSPWIGSMALMGPRFLSGEFPAKPMSAEELFQEAIDLSTTE